MFDKLFSKLDGSLFEAYEAEGEFIKALASNKENNV
jgi:hypothetical protein